jgi:hypothetical protein
VPSGLGIFKMAAVAMETVNICQNLDLTYIGFGDLIRNGANTICLPKLRLGDIIRNGASTTRYDSIWLPNDGYQFATP